MVYGIVLPTLYHLMSNLVNYPLLPYIIRFIGYICVGKHTFLVKCKCSTIRIYPIHDTQYMIFTIYIYITFIIVYPGLAGITTHIYYLLYSVIVHVFIYLLFIIYCYSLFIIVGKLHLFVILGK